MRPGRSCRGAIYCARIAPVGAQFIAPGSPPKAATLRRKIRESSMHGNVAAFGGDPGAMNVAPTGAISSLALSVPLAGLRFICPRASSRRVAQVRRMRTHRFPIRRHPRLPYFDYGTPGWYFVTICVARDEPLSLSAIDAEANVLLSREGQIIRDAIDSLPLRHPGAVVSRFAIMPDHVHLLLRLDPVDDGVRMSLSEIVRAFKASTSRAINAMRNQRGRVWQRGFYDRVVRSEREIEDIATYIEMNPIRWVAKYGAGCARGDRESRSREPPLR